MLYLNMTIEDIVRLYKEKSVHYVVCGSNGIKLWFITAYFPDPIEWTDDFKKRRNV